MDVDLAQETTEYSDKYPIFKNSTFLVANWECLVGMYQQYQY